MDTLISTPRYICNNLVKTVYYLMLSRKFNFKYSLLTLCLLAGAVDVWIVRRNLLSNQETVWRKGREQIFHWRFSSMVGACRTGISLKFSNVRTVSRNRIKVFNSVIKR